MEIKELTLSELMEGYTSAENGEKYICVFCGKSFEKEMMYQSRGRYVTGKRAMEEHIIDEHGGVFRGLMSLDKQVSGLSEMQRELLCGMYEERDNKDLAEDLGITVATVRTHKFNIQRMKREAKILLACLEQIENDEIVSQRKRLEEGTLKSVFPPMRDMDETKPNIGNSLHPFFTQFTLK